MTAGLRRPTALLAVAVVGKLVFHALYLPAFEGSDEPQHLSRVLDFARRPWAEAFRGSRVDADVIAAVRGHPCPRPEVGCPPYGRTPAAFDLLRRIAPRGPAQEIPNLEAKQPPLFYLLAGLPLRPWGGGVAPARALLYVRLLDVGLAAAALFGPLRRLASRFPPALSVAGLLALLTPGAAEALARCSNDAAVFLWASATLAALDRRPRGAAILLLLAAGPMLKLTAFPIAVFGVAALWTQGRRAAGAAGAAASGLVFPIQALRGWTSGGAAQVVASRAPIDEPPLHWIAGFARSAYVLVKTAFWSVGWSLLRPPTALVVFELALILAALAATRLRPRPRRLAAHAAAALALAAGFLVFAGVSRWQYGVWGSVGGWYLWNWSPWIAVAAADLGTMPSRFVPALIWTESSFVILVNVAWFATTVPLFGW